jgi:hypothetical protein
MTEKFRWGQDLVERPVRRLGFDVDGDPIADIAEAGADMLVARRGRWVGIQLTAPDAGAAPDMAVPAETRTEKAVRVSQDSVYGMWGQNPAMDAIMVRPFAGSAEDWAAP